MAEQREPRGRDRNREREEIDDGMVEKLVAVNRVGHEVDPSGATAGSRFWGSSFACGPQGELLWQAGSDETEIKLIGIDFGRSEQVRRSWPFLRDRRIDGYGDLVRRWRDPQ